MVLAILRVGGGKCIYFTFPIILIVYVKFDTRWPL